MLDEFDCQNTVNDDGNPTGGKVEGVGLDISWQDGPLGRGDDKAEPNGAFVETVLAGCKQRLQFYEVANGGKFSCDENKNAIEHIESALQWLEQRTKAREKREVEGTHTA